MFAIYFPFRVKLTPQIRKKILLCCASIYCDKRQTKIMFNNDEKVKEEEGLSWTNFTVGFKGFCEFFF